MADMSHIEMGACSIKVGTAEVGHTAGPVVLHVEPIWRPQRDEKYGEAFVDAVYVGSRVTVTARLLEKTLANLTRALPHGLASGSSIGLGRSPGFRMSSASAQITLHPLECGNTDKDVVIHRAAAYGPVDVEFQEGKERAFLVVFLGLIDPQQPEGGLLATINQS